MGDEPPNNDLQTLIDDIYRNRILRARETPAAEKFATGWALFEDVAQLMRVGIRHRHSEASPEEVENILYKQLNLLQQAQEHGIYKAIP